MQKTSGVTPHDVESLTSSSKARFCLISPNTISNLTRKTMNILIRATVRCRLMHSEPYLISPQPKVQTCLSVRPARPASICHCSITPQGVSSTLTFQPLAFTEPLLAICMWTANKQNFSPSGSSELSEPCRITVTCERTGHLSVQL